MTAKSHAGTVERPVQIAFTTKRFRITITSRSPNFGKSSSPSSASAPLLEKIGDPDLSASDISTPDPNSIDIASSSPHSPPAHKGTCLPTEPEESRLPQLQVALNLGQRRAETDFPSLPPLSSWATNTPPFVDRMIHPQLNGAFNEYPPRLTPLHMVFPNEGH